MDAILADDIFNCILLNENDRIPIQFSLKYIFMNPIDINRVLFQAMAWRRIGLQPFIDNIWLRNAYILFVFAKSPNYICICK